MNKGVANLYRYAQVSQRANDRYLEALVGRQRPGRRPEGIGLEMRAGIFSRAETSRFAAAFTRRSGPVSGRAAG